MSDTVIKVEDLGKLYRLGEMGTGTISHDLNRWWARVRGKEDPFAKIGETNDRTKKGNSEYVWALKNIDFEVRQGEVLGIIGRNGAGKSTLLKILSRVTTPTTGNIKIKGRIASLLEVGTGFHPELTGRENIFLNGAILGMTKAEIRSKFDEIVDFSGVERYIDTPVKRYSSGMYVRLAFAVAAFLEPEILIVDEVLAVGDAEFQKKCLGRMKDVSTNDGRTVLFVSHNMTAINSLCPQTIYFRNGRIVEHGKTKNVIQNYLSTESETISERKWNYGTNDGVACILSARLINKHHQRIEAAYLDTEVGIEFVYEVKSNGYKPVPNIHVFNIKGDHVFVSSEIADERFSKPGVYKTVMWIPGHLLNDSRYIIGIAASTLMPERIHFYEPEALVFDVLEDMEARDNDYRSKIPGVIRPKLEWQTIKID
jgi:lipopolysaccharide transport system ATP-binding protein